MQNQDDISSETQKLRLVINELKVLNDIATTISSIQPVEEVIDQIVVKCIKHLNAEEGTVSLLGRKDNDEQFHTMIRRQDLTKERVPIKLDSCITGWMINNRKSLLSNNIKEDERFHAVSDVSDFFKSLLCAPLIAKGELIGYLAVFNKKNEDLFTYEDRRLLSIIGTQSAQAIENARLYEEEKDLISLQEEMRLAKEIQLKLLPDHAPQIPGYQICATNIPANAVGGDYYDFIELGDGRLGFCVGDISGKGVPAALLMASLQASLRSQSMIVNECNRCIEGTNLLLSRSTESDKFATLFYGILDTEQDSIQYSNAGHNPPLLITPYETIMLESTGLILGIVEETQFENADIRMNSGDILLLYSDGITESMNQEEEEFGMDRLQEIVRDLREENATFIMEKLLSKVKQHSQNVSQSDDITLMVIKKN